MAPSIGSRSQRRRWTKEFLLNLYWHLYIQSGNIEELKDCWARDVHRLGSVPLAALKMSFWDYADCYQSHSDAWVCRAASIIISVTLTITFNLAISTASTFNPTPAPGPGQWLVNTAHSFTHIQGTLLWICLCYFGNRSSWNQEWFNREDHYQAYSFRLPLWAQYCLW